jgi:glucosamine--fructose-6-phosphate aminotransferase (isomerizing)
MCGILCYVGEKEALPILMEGLKRLEYRGYDSAELALRNGVEVHLHRSVGMISELEKKINGRVIHGHCGIAHTRWATHGQPTEENAHPHTDQEEDDVKISTVHAEEVQRPTEQVEWRPEDAELNGFSAGLRRLGDDSQRRPDANAQSHR